MVRVRVVCNQAPQPCRRRMTFELSPPPVD